MSAQLWTYLDNRTQVRETGGHVGLHDVLPAVEVVLTVGRTNLGEEQLLVFGLSLKTAVEKSQDFNQSQHPRP